MSYFKNLSIGTKIMAGFGITLLLMVVVGGLAYFQLGTVMGKFDNLASNISVDRSVAAELGTQIVAVRLYVNRYMRLQTADSLAAVDKEWQTFTDNLATADQHITDANRVKILQQIHTDSEAYNTAFRAYADLVQSRQKLRTDTLDPQATVAQDQLNTLLSLERKAGHVDALYYAGLAAEGVQRMRVNMLKYLEVGDPQWVTRFEDRKKEYLAAVAELGKLTLAADSAQALQAADAAVTAYDQAFDVMQADFAKEKELETQLNDLGPKIRDAGTTIVQSVDADAKAEEKATASLVTETQWGVLAVLAVAIILGLGLGIVITRGITQPLAQLTRSANEIAETDMPTLAAELSALAQGDLTRHVILAARSVAVDGRDEIGQMAAAFNTMIQRLDEIGRAFDAMSSRLRDAVGQVAENAAAVNTASGQLASAAGQAGQATTQIATTIQQVAKGTQQQSESVTKTADSVEQMRRAIDGVAKGAQEQATSVGKASAITGQITTAIEQVSASATAVTQQAAGAAAAARSGSQTVEATIAGMATIRTKVGASAEKVREMGRRSDQIGAIVETIEDIASQTNLLALNAAIEAARAGDHGKGFAVVADEVRKLAERASGATKEIGGLIKGIQATVNEAVKAMDEGAAEVAVGADRANAAGTALAQILTAAEGVQVQAEAARSAAAQMGAASNALVEAMDSVSAVVEENTAATEEMAAGSGEVSGAIENIASVSEENSAAVEEVSASTEEMSAQVEQVTASAQSLATMAQDLQEIVAQFKLSAGGPAQPPAAAKRPTPPAAGRANGRPAAPAARVQTYHN